MFIFKQAQNYVKKSHGDPFNYLQDICEKS